LTFPKERSMPLPLERGAPAAVLQPPLQAFGRPALEGLAMPGDGIVTCELPQPGCLWLRGHADDAGFRRRAEGVLGTALPLQPHGLGLFGGASGGVVLRMSADEWLLVCRPLKREPLLRALRDALLDVFAQVVDTSAGMAALRLAGPRCVVLLQRLGSHGLDGMTRKDDGTNDGAVMSRASVIVLRTDADGVLLVFRRSLVNHVWRLIQRSAEPCGVFITAPAPCADALFTPPLGAA
jgi:sarcosine oxidase subunit gamma